MQARDRYVYLLFTPAATRPFYIGVGKDGARGKRRPLDHSHRARTEKSNPAKNQLLRWYAACGVDIRFEFPHTGLTLDEAYKKEEELIARYGRRELGGCLFNMNAGEGGGRDPVPSTRAKISEANRGNKKRLGKKMSPEAIAKVAAAHRGKKLSAESIAKRSAALRGRKRSPEAIAKTAAAMRGKKLPPEHRAKLSAWQIGRKRSPKSCAKQAATLRGCKHSPERVAKVAAALRGKKRNPLSPETRAKLSAAHLGKKHFTKSHAKTWATRRRRHGDRIRSPDQGEFKF